MSRYLCQVVWIMLCTFVGGTVLPDVSVVAAKRVGQSDEASMLLVGQSFERPMLGGERHMYRLSLQAGEYVRLAVFQYWHGVALRLLDPAGKLVNAVKLKNDNGQTEILTAIADQSGEYKLEVQSRLAPTFKRGSYTLKLAQQRAATAQDRTLVEADRLQIAAYALQASNPKSEEPLSLSQKAIALYEQVYGPQHQELIEPLKLHAVLQERLSKFADADSTYQRALGLADAAFGRAHLETAELLARRGKVYFRQQEFALAKPFLLETLQIREKLLKSDDQRLIETLYDLGMVLRRLNEFAQAEAYLRRSLTLGEQTFGATDAGTMRSLQELGNLFASKGEYGKAEPLFSRAVEALEQLKREDGQLAAALLSLGRVNVDLGNLPRAEPYARRALAIFERVTNKESVQVANVLVLLGRIYSQQKKHAEAEQAYRRAIGIREAIYGPKHSATSLALGGLATVLLNQQKFAEAEPLFRRVIQILEQSANANPYNLAVNLNFLGLSVRSRDLAEAEQCFVRAVGLYEQSLGPNHPFTYEARNNLMFTYKLRKNVSAALAELERMLNASETALANTLLSGDETQKLRYLSRFEHDISGAISLHAQLAPADPQALRQALRVLLLRKGRGLDEMAQVIKVLRERATPADATLFDQYAAKLAQRAGLVVAEADKSASLQAIQLEAEIKKIESALSERSQAFRSQIRPIEVEQVRAALPPQSALVEFVRFKFYQLDNYGPSEEQYAAYILLPDGAVRWAPLGKAEAVEQALAAWRKALDLTNTPAAGQAAPDARKLARQVDALVMQPVRAQLGTARQVFLAPDGALNLLPFAALVDEGGRELVRNYLFVYLTSGRDLLRLQAQPTNKQDVLVFAAPDYDNTGSGANPMPAGVTPTSVTKDFRRGVLSRSAVNIGRFEPLANAKLEAQAIQKLWPQATVYLGPQAQEGTLKQVKYPQILHIVTHGMFLDDQTNTDDESVENPLLHSWLAFAGANQRKSGPNAEEDGILTAYEAAALDLWGTKLVVLSACETGLGEIKNGEGVYGLRRALVLAGAETQVTSLWKVSDRVTRRLMSQYYAKLRAGVGRIEALRQVQLELLQSQATRHPYYWAGFIGLGEWANLAGERSPALKAAPRGSGK